MNEERTILRCLVGSHSYGMMTEASDMDAICVFQAPTDAWLGLHDPTDVRVGKGKDGDYQEWELRKYLGLALKGNPGALELLFTDTAFVLEQNVSGRFLRSHRDWFLSKQLYPRYRGFVYSQYDRMHKDGRSKHGHNIPPGQEYDYKAGSHALRLLWQAIKALREKTLVVSMRDYPDYSILMDVKNGKVGLTSLLARIHEGLSELDQAKSDSTLQDDPNTAAVNDWLVGLRKEMM